MASPLYFAERLAFPAGKVAVMEAEADAYGLVDEVGAAVPLTVMALPKGAPLFRSCTVPVGATPELFVVMVAGKVIWVPAVTDVGRPLIDVWVVAGVIVTGSVFEVLAS